MKTGELLQHILGLDIGANSVGWALLAADGDDPPNAVGIVASGVRIFEAGVEGDLERGREESRGVKRGQTRMARRRLDRVARRLDRVFRLLQDAGLLPTWEPSQPSLEGMEGLRRMTSAELRKERVERSRQRDKLLADLDQALLARWDAKVRAEGASDQETRLLPQRLPYVLRARALDGALEPFHLGRALYHLSQRRGFLSNRKAAPKEEEKKGEVKQGIAKIEEAMSAAGARTLGAYFATLNPEEERIRKRWTARSMYEQEFDLIWAAQAPHHAAILTEEFRKTLRRVIFFQRPLKVQKDLIGDCELEPGHKRAPMALLGAQRFRMLQMVNNTRILTPSEERDLTHEEAGTLIHALERRGDIPLKGKRKVQGAKELLRLSTDHSFNWESGGEERFVGNRTAAKLASEGVFGERWWSFTSTQRDAIVEDVLSIVKNETLARRGQRVWGLDEQAARKFSTVPTEPGYCSHSRQAIAKLLPLMEQGKPYATAKLELYGERPAPEPVDTLPPVSDAVPQLRNPAVHRALTELRKVVNAIVRTYGKPARIRVELARDLRKNAKQREQTWKKNRENEKSRIAAAERIAREAGIPNPTRSDIEKVLLADECRWRCPYTESPINMASLLGPTPRFDIEHIVPFSRSLDDSYLNKTLCEHEENRNRKRNKTPWEAYGQDRGKWDGILLRVRDFQGSAAREKIRRFQMTEIPGIEDFASNQLNDTRYASVEAGHFLALLYGADAKRRIQAGRGGITRFLRDEWGLNSILGDGGEKSREDHRHHAVDAVAIALTDPKTVKLLSDAAGRAQSERRRRFGSVPPPWATFHDDIRAAIHQINVSHRVCRKVNGPLHEETYYSPPKKDEDGRDCVHVRKLVDALSADDIENIVDPVVRERLKTKIQELGGGDPKKLFAAPEAHPVHVARDGRRIPIHKVRVRKYISTFPVGGGGRERHVVTASNHHVEVLETIERGGKKKWEGHVVSCYEAMRRLRAGEPVVKRDHGEREKFLFSLASGETVQMKYRNETPALFTLCVASKSKAGKVELEFRHNADARPDKELRKPENAGARVRPALEALRNAEARKVLITPLGEIRRVGRE